MFEFQGILALLDNARLPPDTGNAAQMSGVLSNRQGKGGRSDGNEKGNGMRYEVRMFAVARDMAGCERISVELPDGATIADLRQQLIEQVPELTPMAPQLMFAIDEQYAPDTAILQAEADIACIPPVSGG